MQRSAMRELAFKLIYEIEVQKIIDDDELEIFIENNEITDEKVVDYLKGIKEGVMSHDEEFEDLIQSNLKSGWSINRISNINISLIKLAIFEMLYSDVPYKVEINEVVELAKKYADEAAPIFINGILASVVKEKKLDEEVNED